MEVQHVICKWPWKSNRVYTATVRRPKQEKCMREWDSPIVLKEEVKPWWIFVPAGGWRLEINESTYEYTTLDGRAAAAEGRERIELARPGLPPYLHDMHGEHP